MLCTAPQRPESVKINALRPVKRLAYSQPQQRHTIKEHNTSDSQYKLHQGM